MKTVFLFCFVLVLSYCNADTLVGVDTLEIAVPSILYGKKVESRVFLADLNKSPKWSDRNSNPPLKPVVAVQNALKYVGTLKHDDEKNIQVGDVTLKRIGLSNYIYIVQVFFYPEGAMDGFVSPLNVVVLMNGVVIKFSNVPVKS
jgi:hypothetical protein